MADNERLICASHELKDSAHGIRFDLPELGERTSGFVVRYNGKAYAYVNECAHLSVELDWNEGDFFDLSRHYLICATHGAQYQPETGYCVLGPCKGRSLLAVEVIERDNEILINLDSLKPYPLKKVPKHV